ncbi:MAG: muconolactone Delta-isomerase family protein [Bacteroidota bacterium]
MINTEYQFMVDFKLPSALSNEFMDLVPYQRIAVNRLFDEGKLVNYSLSLENARLWAIFTANSEMEVMEMLTDLPLTPYMKVEISLLTFYNDATSQVPKFSLN